MPIYGDSMDLQTAPTLSCHEVDWSRLPVELWFQIISYIPQHDFRRQDLALVSKTFNKIIHLIPKTSVEAFYTLYNLVDKPIQQFPNYSIFSLKDVARLKHGVTLNEVHFIELLLEWVHRTNPKQLELDMVWFTIRGKERLCGCLMEYISWHISHQWYYQDLKILTITSVPVVQWRYQHYNCWLGYREVKELLDTGYLKLGVNLAVTACEDASKRPNTGRCVMRSCTNASRLCYQITLRNGRYIVTDLPASQCSTSEHGHCNSVRHCWMVNESRLKGEEFSLFRYMSLLAMTKEEVEKELSVEDKERVQVGVFVMYDTEHRD